LYNILIEFGIPREPVRLIKMCLNETYSRVQAGKNFSDMFPIKKGFETRRCFIAIAFELWFRVCHQVGSGKPEWLERNDIHQLLVHADVDIFGGSIHTIKKNTEASVVASKEMGVEVNANETKNIVMSRGQKAGQCHKIKTENSLFENVKRFGYLGITVKNKVLIREKLRAD